MSASCGRLGLWCSWSEKEQEIAASTCMSCATRKTFANFLRVTMETPVIQYPTRTEPRGSVAVALQNLAGRSARTVSTDRRFTLDANLVHSWKTPQHKPARRRPADNTLRWFSLSVLIFYFSISFHRGSSSVLQPDTSNLSFPGPGLSKRG